MAIVRITAARALRTRPGIIMIIGHDEMLIEKKPSELLLPVKYSQIGREVWASQLPSFTGLLSYPELKMVTTWTNRRRRRMRRRQSTLGRGNCLFLYS